MDKVTLSMQHLPPRDRFAYWREERMQPIIGLTGERDNAGDFAAHLTASISAPLKRIRTRTEGFTAARGTKEIARVGWQDRICLYGQVHGRQQFEQRGREPAPDDLVEERFRNDRPANRFGGA